MRRRENVAVGFMLTSLLLKSAGNNAGVPGL
jgi:hypothetical protein